MLGERKGEVLLLNCYRVSVRVDKKFLEIQKCRGRNIVLWTLNHKADETGVNFVH